ncbi:MAG: RNA-binding protein [Phycisphaeraceae bacterium]|nr:RNA-binding protein [Phycisphaeraceae bacterium]
MAMFKIFVGNLNRTTSAQTVRDLFARYGKVDDVALAMDKETGKPRGFAFVFMADRDEGTLAITKLNRTRLDGRRLMIAAGDQKPVPKPAEQPRRQRPLRGRGASRGSAAGSIRVYRANDEKRLPF